jgi:molybdopterin synthase catalytic subunit/molybdopterin converting factor small subunit
MRVRVLFFGVLRDITGYSEEWLEIPPNSTLAGAFELCAERFATLRERRPSILFARNREFSKPDAILCDNDEIAFLPPVSGGLDERSRRSEENIFRITREPIDSQWLAHQLKSPKDGAVVVFEGVVRDNSKGRATAYLEYECYEEMALAQMTKIGQEIVANFGITRIGIIHRLGRLDIGEASVAVIATAPHRRPAFEAALAGIDRLKREVPIWKKEIFTDGEEWVEGQWDKNLVGQASDGPV